MKFKIIHSQSMYQGRAFSVRKDQVRLPDGQEAALDIVEHSGAVTILPVDDQGNIWFVRQYRHAAGIELLELPAGTLEQGEDPTACAQREIREEIGMGAGKMEKIGTFFLAPGYSTEFMHIFLATELFAESLAGDSDEFLSVEQIPISQIPNLVANGSIADAKTLAAFQLAGTHLAVFQ